MSEKLKSMNAWLKKNFGPNVWATKDGGLGWLGENKEFEEFINKHIFIEKHLKTSD